MTNLLVRKTKKLGGTVKAPPSKAYTHRALIAASLSEGQSLIEDALICDDTLVTIKACSMLGAKIRKVTKGFKVDGVAKPITPEGVIHCGDSGSTIRFMTPVFSLADGISVLTGNESLRRRPMEPLLVSLRQLGVQSHSTRANGCPPMIVFGGGIKGGKTSIRGDISSQFISGLLFGTPKADTDTEIIVTTQLESKPYVTMTLNVLQSHGVEVGYPSDYSRFFVPCGQSYIPCNHLIEGDYSSAAFLLAAAFITDSRVKVANLMKGTLQGDRIIFQIIEKMGADVNVGEDYVEVHGVRRGLKGVNVDLRDAPDLAPVCVVLACFAQDETNISGLKRLRFKESDRLSSLHAELKKMGAEIMVKEDGLVIRGPCKMHGTTIDSHNDHRIAMACAIAALGANGETTIQNSECVKKSYPTFFDDLRLLGADIVGW